MPLRSLLAALSLPGLVLATPALTEDVMIPAEDLPFALEAPGQPQELAALWGNRAAGPAGTLLRTPGGFRAPVHTHTADYRAVVIEGVWSHWVTGEGEAEGEAEGPPLPPGSYWTQVAGQPHADACLSETPCVILLLNEEPYATEVVE